jgi:hypothetical protein
LYAAFVKFLQLEVASQLAHKEGIAMLATGLVWLQSDSGAGAGMLGGGMMLFFLAVSVVCIAAFWKVFTKAGQPGWASIIPIYNAYIMLKIVGRPAWWLILLIIPVVNIVIALIVAIDMAKSFGQTPVFGVVMLFLLSVIGYLVLGFGSARYVGPAAATPLAKAAAV